MKTITNSSSMLANKKYDRTERGNADIVMTLLVVVTIVAILFMLMS